jgi:hypothetical protein
MRAFGPGSVSSFLKIILDVVFAALLAGAAAAALATLVAAVLTADPTLLDPAAHEILRAQGMAGGAGVAVMAAASLYIAGVLIIIGQLRRIFGTLTAGDPFRPENVRRLRLIGGMLALLEVGRYFAALSGDWLGVGAHRPHFAFSPTTWFAVLVVFVLAEVFREGARLRREAELTI